MANAGTVNVNLVAKTAAFHDGMAKAEGAIKSFGGAAKVAAGVIGGFLGYEAIKHMAGWIHQTMEAVDRTSKLADSLGVTTEALQGLSFAGDLAGVSTEAMGAAMLKMGKNLSGIGGESAKVKDGLEAMGLSMQDLQGKTADQQLSVIADGMRNLHSSADRAKVSVDLFGKAGAQMIPLLIQGSEELAKQAKEAEELGIAFSRVDGAKVEAANDALTRAHKVIDGALIAALKELSPLIEGVVLYFVDMAKQAGGFGAIAVKVMDFVIKAIGVAADTLNVFKAGWYAVKVAALAVAMGFIELGGQIATVILGSTLLVNQMAKALGDTGRFIDRAWFVVWQGLKDGASSAVAFVGENFARLLDVIEDGTRFYNDALADSISVAAGKVRASIDSMKEGSGEAMKVLVQDAEFAGKNMAASFSNIGNMAALGDNPILKMLSGAKQGVQTAAEEAAYNFSQAFGKVLNQDGSVAFDTWWATQKQRSQENAERIANEQAAQLMRDQAASAASLSIDQYHADEEKRILDSTILAENEAFTARMEELARFHEESLLSDAEFKLAQENATKAHSNRLADITIHDEQRVTKWQQMNNREKVAFTANTLDNLATLMHSHNKKAFQIGKAAAYASTVVKTAQAAMEAYSALAGIYLVGPALGAAAAAAAIAAGAMQLQQISSASFEGGGGGGGGSFSGGSAGAASVAAAGPDAASTPVFDSKGAALKIDITGIHDDDAYSGRFIRNLIDRINQGQTDGSPVRSMGTL